MFASDNKGKDIWSRAGVQIEMGDTGRLKLIFAELQEMIAQFPLRHVTTIQATLNPFKYQEIAEDEPDMESCDWEISSGNAHSRTLTFWCSSWLYADLIYLLHLWIHWNTQRTNLILRAKRYDESLLQILPIHGQVDWQPKVAPLPFSSPDVTPPRCFVLITGNEEPLSEDDTEVLQFVFDCLDARWKRKCDCMVASLLFNDDQELVQLVKIVYENGDFVENSPAAELKELIPWIIDVKKEEQRTSAKAALSALRSSYLGCNRVFTANLQLLSTNILSRVAKYLADFDHEIDIPKTSVQKMLEEVELLLFGRRTGIAADRLLQDIEVYQEKLYHCLKVDLGADAIIKALEELSLRLQGSSIYMRMCRCQLAVTLSRGYERRNTREACVNNIAFLERALDDLQNIQDYSSSNSGAARRLLTSVQASLKMFSAMADQQSRVAELYGRARLMRLEYDFKEDRTPEESALTIVEYLKTWASKDEARGRLNYAAWKQLISVGVRHVLGKYPNQATLLDVEVMLLDLAKAKSLSDQSDDKDSSPRERHQFSLEYQQCEAGVNKLTGIDIAELQEQLAKIMTKDPEPSTSSTSAWMRALPYLYQDFPNRDTLPDVSSADVALRLLNAAHATLAKWSNLPHVNPIGILKKLIDAHGEFCRAYMYNIWVFNLRFIHQRPTGWVFRCVEEFVKHVEEIFRLRHEIRRKHALTFGLQSFQQQIKVMEELKIAFGVNVDVLMAWCYMFGHWLGHFRRIPRVGRLCWNVWTVLQMSKADSLANLIASNRLLPASFLMSDMQAGPELIEMLRTERDLLREVSNTESIRQPIILHELGKVRSKIASLPAGTIDVSSSMETPLDMTTVKNMIKQFLVLKDHVFVDWLPIQGSYSMCIMKGSNAGAPMIFPIHDIGKEDVIKWLEQNKSKDELDEDESFSDLQNGLGQLVRPLAEHTLPGEKLILCPTGPLHDLPIHALLVDGQLLIERNPITYCHSLSMLRQCIQQFQMANSASYRATVFGDPSRTSGCASEVATTVSENLGLELSTPIFDSLSPRIRNARLASVDNVGEALKTTALYGSNVNKSSFTSYTQDSTLIHYHGHCTYGSKDPLKNGLQLNDGLFSTQEAFHSLHLTCAPLVTLIACASGRQTIQISDEPLGIVPAFLYGGAGAVISTLWPIADRDGAEFSRLFYAALLSPECRYTEIVEKRSVIGESDRDDNFLIYADVSIALQRAILSLRGTKPQYRSLYHWGAFRITGCPLVRIPVPRLSDTVTGQLTRSTNLPHLMPPSGRLEIHGGVGCDGCNMYPLKGPRWKCRSCPDHDFCDGCKAQAEADGHIFERIVKEE
jgi:CHAT domain-containing protein